MEIKFTIQTLSRPLLDFTPVRPETIDETPLPGGTAMLASGSFGRLLLQEIKNTKCCFRSYDLNTIHPLTVNTKCNHRGIFVRFTLKQQLQHTTEKGKQIDLGRAQYGRLPLPSPGLNTHYHAREQYAHVDILFDEELIDEVSPFFPGVDIISIPIANAKRIDAHTEKLLARILKCIYEGRLIEKNFARQTTTLLIHLVNQWTQNETGVITANPHQVDAVYEAEKIITADLGEHYTILKLARMVNISATMLKRLFKQIFGLTINDYLQQKRLQRAKELLAFGLSGKQVADKVGYQESYFSDLFKNVFGITPGEYKKDKYNPLEVDHFPNEID